MEKVFIAKAAVRYATILEFMNKRYKDTDIVVTPESLELFRKIAENFGKKTKDILAMECARQIVYLESEKILSNNSPKIMLLQPRSKLQDTLFDAAIFLRDNETLSEHQLRTCLQICQIDKNTNTLINKQIKYELVYVETYRRIFDIPSEDEIIRRFTKSVDNLKYFYGEPLKEGDVLVTVTDMNLIMEAYGYIKGSFVELPYFFQYNAHDNRNWEHRAAFCADVAVEYQLLKRLDLFGKALDIDLLTEEYKKRYEEICDNYLPAIVISDLGGLLETRNEYEKCYSESRDKVVFDLDYVNNKEFTKTLAINHDKKNVMSISEWKSKIENIKGEQKLSDKNEKMPTRDDHDRDK